MNGFTLLWSKILDSSIWMESKETRIVWITMIAMKDHEGIVRAAKSALAHRARVSLEECEEAIRVMMAPDKQSTTPDNEGRRIKEIPGGWQILNHDLYRFSTEAKREFWKAQKAEQRKKDKEQVEKKVKKKSKFSPAGLTGEYENERLARNGATPEQLQAHEEEHLNNALGTHKPKPIPESPAGTTNENFE